MIFLHGGVPLYGLYIDSFWNFDEKSKTLFGIFVLNGGLQNKGCFGKKWLPFSKNFPKTVDS